MNFMVTIAIVISESIKSNANTTSYLKYHEYSDIYCILNHNLTSRDNCRPVNLTFVNCSIDVILTFDVRFAQLISIKSCIVIHI